MMTFPIVLLSGCKSQLLPEAMEAHSQKRISPVTPQVLTVLLEIKSSATQELPEITVYKVISSAGFLKASATAKPNMPQDGLIIQCIDKSDNILKQELIPNPLSKRYETSDDNGRLISHQVHLEKEIFPFRIQKTPEINTLKIFIIRDQQQVLLQHIEL
jgi:hypothetical protein